MLAEADFSALEGAALERLTLILTGVALTFLFFLGEDRDVSDAAFDSGLPSVDWDCEGRSLASV